MEQTIEDLTEELIVDINKAFSKNEWYEPRITWKEFKELVEAQGVLDHHEIVWIDINGGNIPEVSVSVHNRFIICSGTSLNPNDQ